MFTSQVVNIYNICYFSKYYNNLRLKNMKNIHITKHEDGWQMRRAGSNRASAIFDTQSEAIQKGTLSAKTDHVELFIHNRKGQIRERNSFGNDPYPPKG